ncbi:MAG TPA: hypothetical protein VJN95_08690 [Gemmatimonadales bacterium]|nr:hypothetical protein [Gemmatimonadales bacterium]
MSGLRVEQDGVVVEVPREIESAGGATLHAFVVESFAKEGIVHPKPVPPPEPPKTEDLAPAPEAPKE